MSVIEGKHNSWRTGGVNGHTVQKCGSHTGHAVHDVAFCDTAETANIFVDALQMLKQMHDLNPERSAKIKALLDRAGLLS
jgi:hypothetical protein